MAVGVVDEDGATVYTALRDVHRHAGEFKTGLARHGGRLWGNASSLHRPLRYHTQKTGVMGVGNSRLITSVPFGNWRLITSVPFNSSEPDHILEASVKVHSDPCFATA